MDNGQPRKAAIARSSLTVALAMTAAAAPLRAQRVADLRPAGVAVVTTAAAAPLRAFAADAPPPALMPVAAPARPKPLMPYFVFGGAVLGAGTIVGLAVANCNDDDGGGCWSLVPPFAMVAALGGAIVGGLVGAIVDLDRRHP
jgi:hypothetical protein